VLGWRLLRDAELAILRDLPARLAAAEARAAFLETERKTLTDGLSTLSRKCFELQERLADARERMGAAQGRQDLLIERKNALEQEGALMRSKLFGMPAIATSITAPSAVGTAIEGIGPDLFEDVGDAKAGELGLKDDGGLVESLAAQAP
jgi:hypothetical protein